MAIEKATLTRRADFLLRPDTHKAVAKLAAISKVTFGEICRRAVLAYLARKGSK